ncbi:MAG TPA: thiamine pyrophosphate-binding protein, partial [Xanthobacteraceae bacterium]
MPSRTQMQEHGGRAPPTKENYRGWQSDVIVDLIKRYGFPYLTLNPGASFRGLHDSLVNYGGNDPPMLLCQHEETAVQIAHGYAKASGRPMAVILHDLVGLLHACMAIYYAYIDRAPVFIIGATGPMDEAKRRPHIDWTHSALVQGNAVRDYVKWDYQPTSIEGVPESFARAYSIMTTEPQGPVYMCYDAALQEAPLARALPLPPAPVAVTPAPMAPDPAAIAAIADKLLAAEHPMLLAEYAGRRRGGFESIVELAETTGAAVWDVNNALNFPNRHPLCLSMDKESLRRTDLVVGLDVKDWEKQLTELDGAARTREPLTPPSCDFVEIGFAELNISKWAFDYCRLQPCSVRALGDTALGIPELTRLCRARIAGNGGLARRIAARRTAIGRRHDQLWAQWQQEARRGWDASPISFARLALEIWEVIRTEDWVLTANDLKHQVRKLWDFDRPYRHPGVELGTSTQIGISLGIALAHKGSGRIVVDIQPDGDLMFDAGALWVAAKHAIPILIVMHNNRAYYNDWEHQIRMARQRGTDEAKAHIGMDLFGPEPDFGALARAMGCWG